MLIQGTDRKGNAIPMSAEKALNPAVGRACKALNTRDCIYWVDQKSIVTTSFKFMADKDGVWEAWAEGTALIGKTLTRERTDHHPVPHTFKINYKLSKDTWGIPDIAIIGTPVIEATERDPSKLVGPIPVNHISLAKVQENEREVKRKAGKAQEKVQE